MRLEPAQSSGRKTTSTVVVSAPCILMGFELSEGTGSAFLQIFNSNTSTSDTSKEIDYHATSGSGNSVNQWFAGGIDCPSGIYAVIGGTNAHYIIYYKLC